MYTNSDELLHLLRTKDEQYWISEGEKMALDLFHRAAEQVPAYKDFLQKAKVDHEKIKTIGDFSAYVPVIDKKNYISQYDLKELSWGGLKLGGVVYSSSGTSGKPTFWLRNRTHDKQTSLVHGLLLKSFFKVDLVRTLVVDCFAMGIHVAGYITGVAVNSLIDGGDAIFLATPGSKIDDISQLLFKTANNWEQIILVGYPPLVKRALEEMNTNGFDWSKVKLGLLLAAQGFSEDWRRHVQRITKSPPGSIFSIYGSADGGVMGFETPLSVSLKERLEEGVVDYDFKLPNLESRSPYLFQYLPTLKYFESLANELVFTGDNGVPLIRYNIHDIGGILNLDKLVALAKNIGEAALFKLPGLYLYGRSDYSVIFSGANIYPEHLLTAIQSSGFMNELTGSFFIEVKEDGSLTQQLHLHLELVRDFKVEPEIKNRLKKVLTVQLCEINREFSVVVNDMQNYENVLLHLHEFESDHFSQKQVKNINIKN